MDYSVVLTQAAERDRDETVEYLLCTLGNRPAALSFLSALDEVLANLDQFPRMYPESAEPRLARKGYRKVLIGDYIALYRICDNEVQIARIFHQRQNYARLV